MLLSEAPARGTSPTRIWNILVLCTGNSARSIMAEAIFNQFGGGWFNACSAGSSPTGRVNPLALEQVAACGLYVAHYRSKSLLEFTGADAPPVDLVLTVCDNALQEACTLVSDGRAQAHWSLPDPAAITEEGAARRAFASCFAELKSRVTRLRSQPLADYSTADLAAAINRLEGADQPGAHAQPAGAIREEGARIT